jgi:hypothetical protein
LLHSTEQITSIRGEKRRGQVSWSQQSMEDIDFAQFMNDAQDRIDEDLEKHMNRKPQITLKDSKTYASQILFGSKRNLRAVSRRDFSPESAELSDESSIRQKGSQDERSIAQQNRKRTCIVIGVMALLTAVIVTAVVLPAQMSRPEQRQTNSFPPKKQSMTASNPSPSADTNRTFDSIATFLRTFTTVDDHNFQDATKPQYQAISWMADIDTFAYSIPESSKVDGYFDFIQRYALAVLFYATNGEKWDDSSYFLQSTHACTWNYEILMTKDAVMKVGVTCNGRNEVTALIMRT